MPYIGAVATSSKPPAPTRSRSTRRDDVSDGRWPNLLGAAWRRYGQAVRAALEDAGFGDVPVSGSRVIGVLVKEPTTVGELARRLDLTKQAVSKMSDVLVDRGYASRSPHDQDRRRLNLALTDRGRLAALVIGRTVKRIDDELLGQFDPDQLAALARGLARFVGSTPSDPDSRSRTSP